MLNKIYKIIMILLLLIVLSLVIIDYFLKVNIIEIKYKPKEELVSLVKNIEYIKIKKEEVINEQEVFDGLTLEELANKLEAFMSYDLDGYGYKFASYSLSLGLDPYLALAIVLEETGCNFGCSSLVRNCNNIGGQKGSGCGEYQYFNSIEDGIEGFLNNVYKNYFLYGLTTASTMNSKYAENPSWANNVEAYITKIKNS